MRIEKVNCQIVRLPQVEAKTSSCQDAVIVRIRTDSGLEGIGEADASPEVVMAVIDAPYSHTLACGLREVLLAENPLETRRIWYKMYERTRYFGRTSVAVAAMSAIDVALWDIKGKHFGQPIHRLLGGKQHDQLMAYASILFGADGRETRDRGQRWIEAGYRAVKFGWEPMGAGEKSDIELVRGAREGLGDDALLLVDCGGVWDRRTALRRSAAFQAFAPEWIEEPLSASDVDGYVWLRDRSPIPIAAGEAECGREAFRPLIDRQALDVYQIDLARCGFTDAVYLRDRVEEIHSTVCNHFYTSPINAAAGLHWLSTCRGARLFENCVEDSPIRHDLAHPTLQPVDGWITVPDAPGLGVNLNEDFVREHLVAESGSD